MNEKHTPGPWQVTMVRNEGVTHYRVGKHCETSIAVDPREYWEEDHIPPKDQYGYFQPDEWMDCDEHRIANARLIAAAPDLLTWLGWALAALPSDAAKRTWQYEQALAAIAKATGEPS